MLPMGKGRALGACVVKAFGHNAIDTDRGRIMVMVIGRKLVEGLKIDLRRLYAMRRDDLLEELASIAITELVGGVWHGVDKLSTINPEATDISDDEGHAMLLEATREALANAVIAEGMGDLKTLPLPAPYESERNKGDEFLTSKVGGWSIETERVKFADQLVAILHGQCAIEVENEREVPTTIVVLTHDEKIKKNRVMAVPVRDVAHGINMLSMVPRAEGFIAGVLVSVVRSLKLSFDHDPTKEELEAAVEAAGPDALGEPNLNLFVVGAGGRKAHMECSITGRKLADYSFAWSDGKSLQ